MPYLKLQMEKLREENEAMRARLADMVEMTALHAVSSDLRQSKAQLEIANTIKLAAEEHVRSLEERLADKTKLCTQLQKEVALSVPHEKLLALQASSRSTELALNKTQDELQHKTDDMDALSARLQDMVPRSTAALLQEQRDAAQEKLVALERTLEPAKLLERDALVSLVNAMADRFSPATVADLLQAVRPSDLAIEDIIMLVQAIVAARSSRSRAAEDDGDVDLSIGGLVELIGAMCAETPKRSAGEIARIVRLMNDKPPWSVEDLARARRIFKGANLDDLERLLAEVPNPLGLQKELEDLRAQKGRLSAAVTNLETDCARQQEQLDNDVKLWKDLAENRGSELSKLSQRITALEEPSAPLFATQARKFKHKLVAVLMADPKCDNIYYTVDGSEPKVSSSSHFGISPVAVELSDDAVIKALCIDSQGRTSHSICGEFFHDPALPRPSSYGIRQSSQSSTLDKGLAGVGIVLARDAQNVVRVQVRGQARARACPRPPSLSLGRSVRARLHQTHARTSSPYTRMHARVLLRAVLPSWMVRFESTIKWFPLTTNLARISGNQFQTQSRPYTRQDRP